jgi:CO dehydrogenase/acetyl-CoA synthase gamma subunit (corrinoid Fe-S protein)
MTSPGWRIEQFTPAEVTLSKTIDGEDVEVVVLGLDEDGKVYCVTYVGDYNGEDIDELIAAAGLEKAVIP